MGNDDVVAVGQRPVLAPQRFPGLTTHNHRMGDGQLLEMLHILGTVPRHATIEADGTGATFLVTGFGPDKIHREGLGIIVTPIFFEWQTARQIRARVRDSRYGYCHAPFRLLLLDCGTGP